jgi:hypothetical protein
MQPNFSAWPYLAVPTKAVHAPACSSSADRSTLARVPVRLRRCAAEDLRLNGGMRGGFMQSLIAAAWITLRPHRSACLLARAKVAFAIQEQSGSSWTTVQQIAGNPAERTLGALLPRGGEIAVAYWAWRNWCAGTGTFRTLAHLDGHAVAGATFTETPSCQDPGSPSTLAPNFAHS